MHQAIASLRRQALKEKIMSLYRECWSHHEMRLIIDLSHRASELVEAGKKEDPRFIRLEKRYESISRRLPMRHQFLAMPVGEAEKSLEGKSLPTLQRVADDLSSIIMYLDEGLYSRSLQNFVADESYKMDHLTTRKWVNAL